MHALNLNVFICLSTSVNPKPFYFLTLSVTFEFKFFHNDTADPSVTLKFDPQNINIAQVEQTFITLENRPAWADKLDMDGMVGCWCPKSRNRTDMRIGLDLALDLALVTTMSTSRYM